jgi:hypothetical protein
MKDLTRKEFIKQTLIAGVGVLFLGSGTMKSKLQGVNSSRLGSKKIIVAGAGILNPFSAARSQRNRPNGKIRLILLLLFDQPLLK